MVFFDHAPIKPGRRTAAGAARRPAARPSSARAPPFTPQPVCILQSRRPSGGASDSGRPVSDAPPVARRARCKGVRVFLSPFLTPVESVARHGRDGGQRADCRGGQQRQTEGGARHWGGRGWAVCEWLEVCFCGGDELIPTAAQCASCPRRARACANARPVGVGGEGESGRARRGTDCGRPAVVLRNRGARGCTRGVAPAMAQRAHGRAVHASVPGRRRGGEEKSRRRRGLQGRKRGQRGVIWSMDCEKNNHPSPSPCD